MVSDGNPMTLAMLSASTSAQLLEVQQALAASQADLTTAREDLAAAQIARLATEKERDDLLHDVRTIASLQLEAQKERDLVQAELASARQELETRYRWIVLHAPGDVCAMCGQQMVRSQGVEPLPGSKDLFRHCFCPDKDPT